MEPKYIVYLQKIAKNNIEKIMQDAVMEVGLTKRINSDSKIFLKPNLTYPKYKPGITTSPDIIEALVKVLSDYSKKITIIESDGGYGTFKAESAFRGHNLYEIGKRYGIKIRNLSNEKMEEVNFKVRKGLYKIRFSSILLNEGDIFITMPVPKIHAMTVLSLGFKNQWGCIPDNMRLRLHHIFNELIVHINKLLNPYVISDGKYFLDKNGPMDGEPIKMDLIIAANSVGAFDRYVSELMGISYKNVPHLREAALMGELPDNLSEINYNVHPDINRNQLFELKRNFRNYIALAGFNSRFLTWLGYESWFGKEILHKLLYLVTSRPIKDDL